MDIIYQENDAVVACLPPTRRTFMFDNGGLAPTRLFLSLPYQVVTLNRNGYISMLFRQQPAKSLSDSVLALPLSNTYYNGYICGISETYLPHRPKDSIDRTIQTIFRTCWYSAAGYDWDREYCYGTPFTTKLEEIVGLKLPRVSYGIDYMSIMNFWAKASQIQPEFIMNAPLLTCHSNVKGMIGLPEDI